MIHRQLVLLRQFPSRAHSVLNLRALLALSVTVTDAPRLPDAVGVNLTDTEQLAAGASDAPQVFAEIEKSPAFTPVIKILPIFNVSVPGLDSVTLCAPLVVPMFWLVKVSEVGLGFICGMPYPVPFTVSDWGDPVALSVTWMVPVRAPPKVGEKVTKIGQACPGVSVAPEQPSDETGNSAVFVAATPVIVRLALPVLVTVNFCAALVVPTFCTVENTSGDGYSVAAGPGVTPVPVRLMDSEVSPVTDVVIASEAVRDPVAVGANAKEMVQTARAPRLAPQLLVFV